MPYYPPTVNDGEAFKFAMDVASRWAGLCRLLGCSDGSMSELQTETGAGACLLGLGY